MRKIGSIHSAGHPIADGISLYPVIKWNDELDQGETVGYEFR